MAKFYIKSITNKEQYRRARRRQILRKRIQYACITVGVLAFLFLVGIVGGLEHGNCSTKEFWVYTSILVALMIGSVVINNKLEDEE